MVCKKYSLYIYNAVKYVLWLSHESCLDDNLVEYKLETNNFY